MKAQRLQIQWGAVSMESRVAVKIPGLTADLAPGRRKVLKSASLGWALGRNDLQTHLQAEVRLW